MDQLGGRVLWQGGFFGHRVQMPRQAPSLPRTSVTATHLLDGAIAGEGGIPRRRQR